MGKKNKNSDSESGEVKEELTDEQKNHCKTLSDVEKEKYLSEIYERRKEELDRKRIMNEPEKVLVGFDDRVGKKREHKVEGEGRLGKKAKIEGPIYNHRSETGIALGDIEKIRISRDQLAKWCNHLYFEKTLRGAFVRINIGVTRSQQKQVYLMCEVVDINNGEKFYEIEGKVKTDKVLLVNFGKTKKEMKFDIVSNAEFTQEEFEEYMKRLDKDGMKPITQHHVQTKLQEIQTMLSHKYSRDEIEQLVENHVKESLKKGRVESTAILELEKLRVQLEDLRNSAPATERNEKIKNLDQLVQELEKAIRFDDKIVESDIVHRLNEKNRNRQLEIDSKRAENKKKLKNAVDVIEEKPKLTQFEVDQAAKKRMIEAHSGDLEIDSIVLVNVKAPLREYPVVVFPHPMYLVDVAEIGGKEVVMFDEWKRSYNPN